MSGAVYALVALVALVAGAPAFAQGFGSETHFEFDLTHQELVAGALTSVNGSDPGTDGTNQVSGVFFVNGAHGTHRVDLLAEVATQSNGAPILRTRGLHEFTLTGSDRGAEVWTEVDGDQLLRATIVDELAMAGVPVGPYSVEFYWDFTGSDRRQVNVAPGDYLWHTFATRVRLEAAGASATDFFEETVPHPSFGYLSSSVDVTKSFSEYVVLTLDGQAGTDLTVTTTFELEPDTRLDNSVEGVGALNVDGEHAARFDASAVLIGVVVRDSLGVILPNASIASAAGYDYPVLPEPPSPPQSPRTILSPVAIQDTDLGEFNGTVPLENMINQSLLEKPFLSGITGFDNYFDFLPESDHENNYLGNWQSDFTFTLPMQGYVDFDLGGTYWIDRIAIWNRTLKDVRVQISDSATGPWQEIGSFVIEDPGFGSFYPAQIIDLGGEYEADYVRFQIDSTHTNPGDTFAYAIVGEVAMSASLTPVPEPGSILMAAVGAVGLVILHRRKEKLGRR